MIFNPALYQLFQTLEVGYLADELDKFLTETYLTPNSLHINAISLSMIQNNQAILKEILSSLKAEEISSDIPALFLKLIKDNLTLRQRLALSSRTGFLQLLLASWILGFILEILDFDVVKSKNFNFRIN